MSLLVHRVAYFRRHSKRCKPVRQVTLGGVVRVRVRIRVNVCTVSHTVQVRVWVGNRARARVWAKVKGHSAVKVAAQLP